MKRINLIYHTKSGKGLPITVSIERIAHEQALEYLDTTTTERNDRCTHGGKPCAQYDTRPCCPPRIKIFSKLPERKYLYLLHLKINAKKYHKVYPKQKGSAFMMTSTAGNYLHSLVKESLLPFHTTGSILFKINGCSGCTYTRKGKCKLVMPMLEGTGLNVVAMSEDIFNSPVHWLSKDNKFPYYTGMGGLYTDSNISPSKILKSLSEVCNKHKEE